MDISINIGDPPPGEPWTYLHVGAPPGVTIDISLFSVTMGISTCRSFSSRCNHIHIYMFVSGCGRGELHWPRWWESDAARTPPPGRHGAGRGRGGRELSSCCRDLQCPALASQRQREPGSHTLGVDSGVRQSEPQQYCHHNMMLQW